jgi:hypothetical protein
MRAEDVANSRSAASWAVQGLGWKDLAPALSDEAIALVAPPVVVTAQMLDAIGISSVGPAAGGAVEV